MPGEELVHTELWTSWASLLRSYAAAHGLHAPQHAVVEVSYDTVTLRVGPRWLRFTHTSVEGDSLASQPFRLRDNGTVATTALPGPDEPELEMDLAAEHFARILLLGGSFRGIDSQIDESLLSEPPLP